MTNVDTLKSQAKRLRNYFASQHIQLSHSQALEAISAAHGFKDWNSASALSPKAIDYPTTDETVEQLMQRIQAAAKAHVKKRAENPAVAIHDDEKREANVLFHQLGVAIAAARRAGRDV